MTIRRLFSQILAALMLTTAMMPLVSRAEWVEPIVRSAPLTKSADALDGMVRVYLSSLGNVTSLDVTVAGSYSVEGTSRLTLTNGQKVSIQFSTATGQINMTTNGRTYAMGSEMALRRHQTSGESGLRIAQANRPSNLYPGDLHLISKASGGVYKLYPVVHVYIEYYLYGVVPYEMSSSWPAAALCAQAVAARTYTLNRMQGRTAYIYDLVDTSSDQVYNGYTGSQSNATRAVDATRGIVIMNNGKLSGTYYTASNGGQTEAVANIWGSKSYPYLGVKDDPFDLANPNSNRRKLVIYGDFYHAEQNSTLRSILLEKARSLYGSSVSITRIESVTPHSPKYDAPSRLYTKLDFEVMLSNGRAVTLTFSIFDELESQLNMSINSGKNELWYVERDGSSFILRAGRYGHGVGMSQRGAQQMANMGYTYDQILGFYFEGCERVQYTFTHTVMPPIGSGDDPVVSTEAPATIAPETGSNARIQLTGVGGTLPLRYTPADNGRVLITAINGSSVNVLCYGSKWSMIQYGQICGYVPTSALVISGTPPMDTSAESTSITRWGTVTGSTSLNLRDGGSYSSNVIGAIPGGGIVAILAYGSDWCRVQYGQQAGYAATSFLTISSEYPEELEGSGSTAMVSLPGGIGAAPLRSAASTTGAIILYVDHGTQVTVHSDDGSWCRVSVGSVTGYMLATALDFSATGVVPTDKPLVSGECYAIVASEASTLNLRSGPSTNDAVIAEIPRGTQIIVTSRGSEWCAVRWGSLTGYVMTEYLTFHTDGPTAAPSVTDVPSGSAALVKVSSVLYASANTQSSVLLQIPAGQTVSVLMYGETWSKITYVGLTGYVLTETLLLYQDMMTESPATASPSGTPSAMPTASPTPAPSYTPVNLSATIILNAQMREEPSTGSRVLTTLPAGSRVTVTQTGVSWCEILFEEQSGWVLTTQLNIHEEEAPTASPDLPENEEFMELPGTDAEGKAAWVTAAVDSVNLRAEPSTDAEIYRSIPSESAILVISAGETWSLVLYDGMAGYVFTKYISYVEPMEALGQRYISTASDPLALRDAPSTDGKLIARMERGSMVALLEEYGDWCLVQYGELRGYCAARYLSVQKPDVLPTSDTRLLDYTLTDVTGWEGIINEGKLESVMTRAWCTTDAPDVAELLPETRVQIIQKGDIWCLVAYEGKEGYCLTSQIRLIPPAE